MNIKLNLIALITNRMNNRTNRKSKDVCPLCESYFCDCDELLKDTPNEVKNNLYFTRKEKIVETTNSVVFKCTTFWKNQKIAFKKIRLESDWGVPIPTIPEMSAMRELKHPNIVSLMYMGVNNNILYLVYEFFPIDLKKYMDNLAHGQLLERQLVKNYLNQITQGIYILAVDANRSTQNLEFLNDFDYFYDILSCSL